MNFPALVFEEFEPRILYSADLAPLALAGLADQQIDAQWRSASDTAHHEIAFVDLSLPEAQTLIDDLRAQAQAGRDIEVVTIAAGEDGIALIGETLAQRRDIGAVHLLSHGSDGLVLLGSSQLDATTLLARAGEVASWGQSLTADADLLIYGCDVAASARGQQFVAGLAALTGADVAASSDVTGSASRGANWQLELASGGIEAGAAVTQVLQQSWGGLLLATTSEIPVNTTSTTANQTTSAESRGSQQAVSLDAAGNYVVVWSSVNQDGAGYGVYARRFDATGTALTAEILVNSTTNNDQKWARVASDAAGNFIVTWTSENQDGTPTSVYARRFDASGVALAAETRVNTTTTGAQTDSVIAMNASNGDYVIAWQGEGPGDTAGIFFRRFFADGTAKDAADRLANLTNGGTENDPAVTMDASGKFVIAWEVGDRVYIQRFDAAGTLLGSAAQVDSGLSPASEAAIASDAAGNFTVTYRTQNAFAPLAGVWVKGFNADGTLKYSWAQVDSGDASNPSIAMAADGAFVVVYDKTGDGSGTVVYSRQYNADGSAAGVALQVNQTTAGPQANASVAVFGDRSFVVAWSGTGPGDGNGVFARQFGASVQIAAAQDAYINSGSSSNFGTSASLVVDRSGGNLGNGRALLQFDLSTIPPGATITGATLELQATANASPFMIDVYRLTEAWVEGNGGTSAANWNDRLTGTAWTDINGASVDPTPAATWAALPSAGAGLHSWDLTNLVRAWQTGSSANHGILLGSKNSGSSTTTYGSSESLTPPRLVVSYTLGAAPVIGSNGGGDSASISVAENTTAVTTVAATDADLPAQTLTYSIGGGADAARFSIDTSTGALSFVAGPNFELPTDAGANNVYDVTVQVSDGTRIDKQAISVTVTAVNDNTPVITSNGGGDTAAVTVAENTTAVTTVVATDADLPAQTLTYSISGGADAARFTINATTGALSFAAPPNFEAPTDTAASNVYDVIVQASDGTLTDSQAIAVTVTPLNDNNPVITSNGGGATATITVAENATAVATVTATDADLPAQTLTYSITGGADATRFSINTSTGALSFIATPNYEVPTDAGANNVYNVTVRVSDGTRTDTQAMAVTVSDANEFPVGAITDANVAANSVAETAGVGTLVGATANAVDSDASSNAVTYTLDNSAGGRFAIDGSTGVLSVAGVLDFEASNSHTVTVRATSADGSFSTALFTIGVTDVSEASVGAISDVNAAANKLAENAAAGTLVSITASAFDIDALDVVTYSLIDDAGGRFAINTTTGVVVVAGALDAETALGHTIVVRADSTDGSFNTQAFTIAVTDVNEFAIAAVSDSDASVAAIDENMAIGTLVGITASAVDADATNNTASYSLDDSAGGRFAIDTSTGVVTVDGAIDREVAPGHAIVVRATSADGSFSTQNFAIAVNPVNDNAPDIVSDGGAGNTSINVAENSTAVTTVTASDADLPAQTLTYSIIGGADQALFNIGASTGELKFATVPDHESPLDAGGDNVYDVTVQVSDGSLASTQVISVTVSPLNEAGPVITSDGGGSTASVSVAENSSAVTTVVATDADLPAPTLAYSIVGGADRALFSIDANSGVLNFITAPDHESPADAAASNVYDVTVQASDGGLTTTQSIRVTVTPVDDAGPVIGSDGGGANAFIDVAENGTAVTTVVASDADLPAQTLAYSIVGGADQAMFSIDASTGVLRFVTAPDYETPNDADADNIYDVTVQVSDGTLTDAQAIAVTITATNDSAPVISSNGGGLSAAATVAENNTRVTTVNATDADLPTQTLRYSIVGGADAAKFSIDASTGVLSLLAAPDFEAPADAGADNVYDVVVQVGDGGLFDSQAIAVTVTNTNEAPVIVSNGLVISEGGSATPSIAGADADTPAGQLVYTVSALVGGQFERLGAAGMAVTSFSQADVAAGLVRFVHDAGEAAPAFQLRLSDGVLATAAQAATVSFTPVNDAPAVLPVDLGAIAEDSSRLVTAAQLLAGATDAEGDGLSVANLTLVSGQASLVDQGNGNWLLTPVPNWNGSVTLRFDVSDGMATLSNTAGLAVAPVADPPRITSQGGAASAVLAVAENTTAATTVAASPGDGPGPLRYTISGGADAAAFSIDAASGVLRFVTAPDRERPTDAGADNRYEVTLRVSDGALFDEQAIAVDVGNVDEAPTLLRNELQLDNGSPTVVLLATDPDTPDSALVYQTSGEVGGQFERIAAPGAALSSFTQADVNAGNVRFVADGSGLTPAYALQLSDGVTTSAPARPTLLNTSVVSPPVAAPEVTTLPAPAAELVGVPAAVPANISPAALAAVPAPAGKPGTATLPQVSQAPPASAAETPTGANTIAMAFERLADRSAAGRSDTGELRTTAHDVTESVAAAALQIDLMNWAQLDANAGADTSTDAPRQELAAALRARSLSQALDNLRRGVDEAQGTSEQLVVGSTTLSAGLSVGYVLWLARGGVLMASVLSALPAWASLDPLPVLGQVKGKAGMVGAVAGDDDDEDDDAVENLFDKRRTGTAPRTAPPAPAMATPQEAA